MAGQGTGDRLGAMLALCHDVARRRVLPEAHTPAEKALYDSQRAAEMARAEARRNPPAEPDLLEQAAA